MSKDKNTSENINNDCKHFYKICDNKFETVNTQLESNKSLLKFYEEEDYKNVLTSNGRELLYKAKTIGIYVFWVALILTLISMKKTLDNIDARVHNAPSVTTK
jgi:hypothetical protein